jgi:hypothetical protein
MRLLAIPLMLTAAMTVSTKDVVKAGAKYVEQYQRDLTAVVADEIYTQAVREQFPVDTSAPSRRTMKSEIFFMFASEAHGWMAIRDVATVDGEPVDDRPDVRRALRTTPASEVAESLKSYNSRFNLGRVFRNFNEPTLSLRVLDDDHRDRFSFDQKQVERNGDAVLVTLAFSERRTPTLIRGVGRGNVFSTGELIVDAATGRVIRTRFAGRIGPVQMELTTVYAADDRLGMWVPVLFQERYQYSDGDRKKRDLLSTEREEVVCEARYSNFRRFETSARIVK